MTDDSPGLVANLPPELKIVLGVTATILLSVLVYNFLASLA